MIRLTKKMEDGSYRANDALEIPGENSYDYKNAIIDRCGRLEDFLELLRKRITTPDIKLDIDTISIIQDLENLKLDIRI